MSLFDPSWKASVIISFGGAPFLTITYDPRGLGIRDSQLTIWCTDGQSCSGSAASGLGPRKSKVNKRPMKINEDPQQRAMMDTDGSCRDSKWFKLLGDLWTASAVCFQSSCADEAHALDSQNLSMIAAASVWCMWQCKSCRSTAVQAWDFAEVKKSRVGLKWIKFELAQTSRQQSGKSLKGYEGLDAQHDLVMWRIVPYCDAVCRSCEVNPSLWPSRSELWFFSSWALKIIHRPGMPR